MDEKGFAIGVTSKTKHVFLKILYQEKMKTAGLQDGNREWVIVLACTCKDGSKIDPAVIFAEKHDLCSACEYNVEPGKHRIFFGTLPTGWTNNDLYNHIQMSDVRYYLASSPGPIRNQCAYAGAPPCWKLQPENTRTRRTRIHIHQSIIKLHHYHHSIV
jgi:hypothetical protein